MAELVINDRNNVLNSGGLSMKKYLLVGCAGVVFSLGLSVADAQNFKVTLSGEGVAELAAGSGLKGANQRTLDMRNRFRLRVNPEAVGLNGALTYGAKVRLLAASSDGSVWYDQNYIYAKGAFGTLNLGDLDTYGDEKGIMDLEGIMYSFSSITNFVFANAGSDYASIAQDSIFNGEFSKKARYDSPFVNGFQVSLAYSPKISATSYGWGFDRGQTGLSDVVDTNITFDSTDPTMGGKFGPYKLQAGFDYIHGNAATGYEDFSAYQAALRAGYEGFMAAVTYYNGGHSKLPTSLQNKPTDQNYNISAQYQDGAYTFGVNYSVRTMYNTTVRSKLTENYLIAGVKYKISPGLTTYVNYGYVREKNYAKDTTVDANVGLAGLLVSF